MNKRHTFTLVEILFVIGIIIILSTLILSAVIYAPKKARMAAAKSDITALYNAIRQFEADYGAFPAPTEAEGVYVFKHEREPGYETSEYKWLIQVLQGKEPDDATDEDGNPKYGDPNSRRRKYLDIQGNEFGEFKDPWDLPYNVIINLNYDGKIPNPPAPVVPVPNPGDPVPNPGDPVPIPGDPVPIPVDPVPFPDGISRDKEIRRDIVIWSKGPDKKSYPQDRDEKKAVKKNNKDNIYSFNTNWDSKEQIHIITR